MRKEMALISESMGKSAEEFIKALKRDAESNAYKFEQL